MPRLRSVFIVCLWVFLVWLGLVRRRTSHRRGRFSSQPLRLPRSNWGFGLSLAHMSETG
jgi:hypothetical protein